MAANNYFGFTHGGTQYGAQATTPYPATAQTAYVQPTHQAAFAAAPRPQTYEAYPATHTTGQYAYATRAQPTAATYDAAKTYYTPTAAAPAAAAAAAATAVYTVAETAYQTAAKPAYSSTSYTAATTHRPAASTKPVGQSSSYVYTSTSTPSTTSSKLTANTGYDAALYSAATNYYQQQQVSKTGTSTGTSPWVAKKTGFTVKPKPKQPPKAPQLHYCEVCKISCAGPQTYREHLEGQKHKKKEAAAKAGGATTTARGQNQLRCELCDVACTGTDAYAAHIRGAKHQKVLKLHTRLGKSIPTTEPTVLSTGSSAATKSAASATGSKAAPRTVVTAVSPGVKKVVATPKINFVGGTTLKSTGNKTEEVKSAGKESAASQAATVVNDKGDGYDFCLPGEKDIVPVGEEYIEEVRNELGSVVSFHCKLCECKFNDPNAKVMHLKGRRHRLQYKKKVDPSLQVEVKPSIRTRKLQEEKLRRQAAKEEFWRRRDAEERWRMEWEQRRYEEEFFGGYHGGPGRMPYFRRDMHIRRPDTIDDRHVMAKHASIYPNEAELQSVQNIVSCCEKALKQVSDVITDSDSPKPMDTDKKETAKTEKGDDKKGEKKDDNIPRALKGVMRVGVLAKGLLLHSDLNVNLVVLCSEKPTRTLLGRLVESLPKQLQIVSTDDKYEVKMCVEEAAVIVTSEKEPKTSCTVTLTSPVMRDENTSEGENTPTKPDPPDVLDRQKCLQALASLRHAKWFQARANGLQSCVVVIRILRDLCQRVPTWTPLQQWAMELLVEKCVSSGGINMSPGDALRRVFEAIASGILLPGGPGLCDPCEKEQLDASSPLNSQEREDITASAQHALRLISFRQIHKVLGMDHLPAPKYPQGKRGNPRKRRLTDSTGEGGDEGEGKKDKKDEEGQIKA